MTPSDLQQPVLLSVLGAGLATAFLHAALPTHWLPFVLVGRAQRWSLAQVMSAVVTAGLAHIVTTAVVGSLIVMAGLALDRWIAGVLPWISAGLLFAFGTFYVVRAVVRGPVLAGGPPMDIAEPSVSHRAAFIGLVATLVETRKGEKIKIFKKTRRQGYRRTNGHRQMESVLRITGIDGAGENAKWDGETSLMTKAEMNLRARGLAPRTTETEVEAKPAKKAAAPKAAPKAEAAATEDKPAAKKAPAKKAAAPKAKAAETDEA